MNEKKWTPEEDAELLRLLKEKKSLREIAGLLGRTRGSVAGAKFRLENCQSEPVSNKTRAAFERFVEQNWQSHLPMTMLDIWNDEVALAAGFQKVSFQLLKWLLIRNNWQLTAADRKQLLKERFANFNERSLAQRAIAQEALKGEIFAIRDLALRSGVEVCWRDCTDCKEHLPVDPDGKVFLAYGNGYFAYRCRYCYNEYRRLKHNLMEGPMLQLGKRIIAIHARKRASRQNKTRLGERDVLEQREQYLRRFPDTELVPCSDCTVEPKLWPKVPEFMPGFSQRQYLCRICYNRRKRKAAQMRRLRSKPVGEE